MKTKTIIVGGHIIDPRERVDVQVGTVIIENGKFFSIDSGTCYETPSPDVRCDIVDASGCLVVPGLIDLHTHLYEHVTPLGVNADNACLNSGVTTAVDAGSAGSATYPGFHEFIRKQSNTRMFNFLHIANHGLASAGCVLSNRGGECDSLNQVNVQSCVECVKKYSDNIVGVKVRLAKEITGDGVNEAEVYRRALQARKEANCPLMVHHAISTIPTGRGTKEELSCPGSLEAGDIYTHCFHGQYGCIVDPDSGKLFNEVWQAKRQGVLFDVGHGGGSFSWDVAEQAAKENFWPDIISTDLHQESISIGGQDHNLPAVMSKMFHLGMTLVDVIAAVTNNPAQAINKPFIGSLCKGCPADLTILKVTKGKFEMSDCHGRNCIVEQMFQVHGVVRGGQYHAIKN